MPIEDVLHDKGGAGYHRDAYTSWSALFSAMTSGGVIILGPQSYDVAAGTVIDHEIVFQEGAVLKPAAGSPVILTYKPRAGFYRIFDTSAGGSIQFAWGATDEIYPEWWGIGTETQTTAALRAAVLAAGQGGTSLQTAAGTYVAALPAVVLRPRTYAINDEIDCGGGLEMVAPGGAIIQQTVAGKRIFYSATKYVVHTRIQGVHFVGGTRQVEFANPNIDAATLKLVDCTFDVSTDYAVWTMGSNAVNGLTILGALTAPVSAGQTTNVQFQPAGGADPYLFRDVFINFRHTVGSTTTVHVTAVTAISAPAADGTRTLTLQAGPPWAVATGENVYLDHLTTLAAPAAGGARSVYVYSTTGGINGLKDVPVAISLSNGETHATITTGVSNDGTGWKMDLLHPLPSHWSSAGGGTPVYAGDIHLSANVSIERCQFQHCRRVLLNTADSCVIGGDTWVYMRYGWVDADTPAVTNLSGVLRLKGFFGVPQMIDPVNGRVQNTRWIDMCGFGYGLEVANSRFGGEDAGMPVVEFWTPPHTDIPGTWVEIRDSNVVAGPDSAGGVVTLRSNVPQLVVYRDNEGPFYNPVIRNGRGTAGTGVNLATYFDSFSLAARRFRFVVGPNLDFISRGVDTIPPELRRFADVEHVLPLPRGPVPASPAGTNAVAATFNIPSEIVAFYGIVTMSGSVAGASDSRAVRSDLVTLYRTVSGSTVTETIATAGLHVPSGSAALAAAFAGGGASRTVTTAVDRDVTFTYTGIAGSATVSLHPLHQGT